MDKPNDQQDHGSFLIKGDLTLIAMRISWDQNGYLYTRGNYLESCYLDNYRLITVYEGSYPQRK